MTTTWTDHTFTSNSNWLDAIEWNAAAKRDGVRARVLCTPVSDLFADEVTDDYRYEVFGLIANCDRLDWLLLTGHPQKMREFFTDTDAIHAACCEGSAQALYQKLSGEESSQWFAVHFPMPNVWLGTPVENQAMADERVPILRQTPAAVRFLYCEPLLGPGCLDRWLKPDSVHFNGEKDALDDPQFAAAFGKMISTVAGRCSGIQWVICGAESGPKGRKMETSWAYDLAVDCDNAGVNFFMDRMEVGGKITGDQSLFPDGLQVRQFPKIEVAT